MDGERLAAIGKTEAKNRQLAIAAAHAMDGQRAEDIVALDLRDLVDYSDYFVIASASSAMRIRGVVKAAEKVLAQAGGRRLNQPDAKTGWSLLDYGDVIVHVFDPEAREYYRIEDLWGDAPRVDWRETPPPGGEKTAGKTAAPRKGRPERDYAED